MSCISRKIAVSLSYDNKVLYGLEGYIPTIGTVVNWVHFIHCQSFATVRFISCQQQLASI